MKAVSPNEDTTDTSVSSKHYFLLTHLTKILSMLRLHIQGFVPSETLKEWQIQMTALLHQQHSRGGTITVVADDVIDETWVGI